MRVLVVGKSALKIDNIEQNVSEKTNNVRTNCTSASVYMFTGFPLICDKPTKTSTSESKLHIDSVLT